MTSPKQQRNQAAVEGAPLDLNQSDDSKLQFRETERLQREAQARIDKTRHDTIGQAP